jgi:glucosamine 6-phosphate synthetase-like amidotransferase/phosphosugar isomerase protein
MWYRVPVDATIVMGHTRMTTQGSALRNENNHPFRGKAGNTNFALAHNGILYNDRTLRKEFKLPASKIETDSYIAVQLLEQLGRMDFEGLRAMAEELEGSYTITALTERDELYFVKGNNPMCIYHYPAAKLYVYASTEEILKKAMLQAKLQLGKSEKINLSRTAFMQNTVLQNLIRMMYRRFTVHLMHWLMNTATGTVLLTGAADRIMYLLSVNVCRT